LKHFIPPPTKRWGYT